MTDIQKIDYSGRTVDLLLLKTILDVPVVNRRVDIDADGDPMIVSGIEKMAQRYALSFINAMGSTKFRQGHGTNIVPRVGAGMVYSMATLETAAAEANLLAFRQMQAADMAADAEGDATPDDERITSSTVYDLVFSREKAMVRISVRLATAAGKSYVYIIPVAVGVH